MPVFHTKTISSILDPVANQISQLVIINERTKEGIPVPNLDEAINALVAAVSSFVHVAQETAKSSDDPIMQEEFQLPLLNIVKSVKEVTEANNILKQDNLSLQAADLLNKGSNGILHALSNLLLALDQIEVRKILKLCYEVLEYLLVVETVDSVDDLLQFIKNISPKLTSMNKEVNVRQKELTNTRHSEILINCLNTIRDLCPALISSLKMCIQISAEHGGGLQDATENRSYLMHRMIQEIREIIRVLKLTKPEDDDFNLDNPNAIKKIVEFIDSKIDLAKNWAKINTSPTGGSGENALQEIIDVSKQLANRCNAEDSDALKKLCFDLEFACDALIEQRVTGKSDSKEAEILQKSIVEKLSLLQTVTKEALAKSETVDGSKQISKSLNGKVSQIENWLLHPQQNSEITTKAINDIVEQCQKLSEDDEIQLYCDEIETLKHELCSLSVDQSAASSERVKKIAGQLSQKLKTLKNRYNKVVVQEIMKNFADTNTPLKRLSDCASAQIDDPNRDQNFHASAKTLQESSDNIIKVAKMLNLDDDKKAEELKILTNRLEKLTPQLIMAGKIKLQYPNSKISEEHFENLRVQYEKTLKKVREICNENIHTGDFIEAIESQVSQHIALCEEAILEKNNVNFVQNVTFSARLANSVIVAAQRETENSEDPVFVGEINQSVQGVEETLRETVQNAKGVSQNIRDEVAVARWRDSSKALLLNIGEVKYAVTGDMPLPPLPAEFGNLSLDDDAPPRPPLPSSPPSETDDETEYEIFKQEPIETQPIMVAAHNMHREVNQWSTQDNELVAKAKYITKLMAKLSMIANDPKAAKKEFLDTAMEIVTFSSEIMKIVMSLAGECTDKRLRSNLLSVSEKIPTLGTQLKIISTVKSVMLGTEGMKTKEDLEATELLELNAKNIMKAVTETVKAAESASVKIKANARGKFVWVKKQPKFVY